MNQNPKDEAFDEQTVPPPQINENQLLNTDVHEQNVNQSMNMDTREQNVNRLLNTDTRERPGPEPRPRHHTAPLGAPLPYPASPPPYVQPGVYPERMGQQRPRRHRRWPWVVGCLVVPLILLLVLAAVVVFGFVLHAGPAITTTRHFSVGASPTLIINDDIGTIVVHTGSASNAVTIAETRTTSLFGGSSSNLQVTYQQSNGGNTITVNINRPNGTTFFNSPIVNFDVSAPNTANLQLKTGTGSVSVNGIRGQMSLQSSTGSVSASQVGLTGSSTLMTSTGSVHFSGDIGTDGTYRFQSNTGSVNVTLPRSASFHLNATTNTGSLNSSFPDVHVQHNTVGSQASGDIGQSPTATVILTTNTGSINLNAQS